MQWIYLKNIFSAVDIQKQLPSEYTKFHKIDKFWIDTMFKAFKKPGIFDNISDEEFIKSLKESNKQLDNIQKMLEDYLELKRKDIPEFNFLSDDDLLEIYLQIRNPESLQPHLKKFIDDIKAAKLDQKDNEKETDNIDLPNKDPETAN